MINPSDSLKARVARALVDVVPGVNRTLRAAVASRMAQRVTLPQYRALVQLKDVPSRTLKDLADREGVEPPTMSRTIEALVGKGLVGRQPSPEDRRCVALVLTGLGAQLVDSLRSEVAQSLEQTLSAWADADLQTVLEALSLVGDSPLYSQKGVAL
jgi:DNA-binding MarR family transcriptional regulator